MKRILLVIACLSALLTSGQTLTVTPTTTNVTCFGANNGTANIAVSGCNGTPTFVWTPNVSSTNSATGLAPGSYTVNVTTPGSGGTQTVFSDNFDGALNWVVNTSIGTQGPSANAWIMDDEESWDGQCGSGNLVTPGDKTLHMYCTGQLCSFIGSGAIYNAGGFGGSTLTDKFASTINNINTTGLTNIQVSFGWRCMGQTDVDYANMRYSIDGGNNWIDLPTRYQDQDPWACAVVTLPVACENITTLKIGYRWRNNNDGVGSDPTIAIDDVVVTGTGSGGSGCTGSTTFTITQPASALTGSISSQTNLLCFGQSTGSVTVAGAGGTTNYQYKIGNGPLQASGTFSGLAAGTYTITVQDANSCTTTVPVTITGPSAALTGSITNQTQTGCGTNTGSVTVAGAGGTTGYQYKLDNGPLQGNGTFSNLAAGTYIVTVQDANNCTTTVSVTITSPSGLTLSNSTQTNVLCFGQSTGSVTVAGANGTPSYQYKIGNGSYQPSGTFSGLAAGTYTITVLDGASCTTTLSVTITGPSQALSVANSTQTNVLCFGNSTGSVTVAGSGGSPSYQYKIGNGTLQPSGTFSGLAAGTYTITVQDANSCTSTVSVTITGPSQALTVSNSTQTNVLCFGGSTGSVTVVGAGGTTNYQYKIGTGSYQASGTFNGLSAGTYVVTIQDANNCTSTVTVSITQPNAALTGSITNQTQTTCGGNTGSVTVAGAGGTTGYQYKLDNGPLQGNGTFSNLAAGTYTVTVQDASCTITLSVNITGPSQALSVANSNQTNVLCFGNSTGFVTVAGSGGSPSYQYKIGNGALQPGGTFSGLAAGTYTITIQDANSCTSTVSVTITQPNAALSGSVASQTPASCGSNNGSVTVSASGGTTTYQYKIDNGALQASPAFTGLAGGPHTVTIQDANGCTTTVQVTITTPSNVTASISNFEGSTCNGTDDGSIDIAGSGGTPNYQYSLDGTTYQANGSFTGLAAGNYVAYVKDNAGCIDTIHVTLTEPAPVVVTTAPTGITSICEGQQLTITVTSNGNTCSWSNGAQGNSIVVTAGGNYNVTCQDNNGCTGTSANVVVNENPLPFASFNSEQVDNYHVDFTNGSIDASTYVWVFPGGSTNTDENPTFNFPAEGNYNVMLIATNACGSDTLTQIIGVDKLNGVEELGVLSSFNLYPNPANGAATIKMEASKPVKGRLTILTVDGRLVFGDTVSFNNTYSNTVDLSKLSAGIYIVNLVGDNININRKLIIEK